jgi:hypothetical protein
MQISPRKPIWTLRVTVAVLLCSFSTGLVLADGIKSKDKLRSPESMDIIYSVSREQIREFSDYVRSVLREKNKDILVRVNTRLKARVVNKPSRNPSASAIIASIGIDRERLVKRGKKSIPLQCQPLHTHERATCIRDTQVRQMARYAETILKVSKN